jgi:hypothetical protein
MRDELTPCAGQLSSTRVGAEPMKQFSHVSGVPVEEVILALLPVGAVVLAGLRATAHRLARGFLARYHRSHS